MKFEIEVSVGDEETTHTVEAEGGSIITALGRGLRELRKDALKGRRLKVLNIKATELK